MRVRLHRRARGGFFGLGLAFASVVGALEDPGLTSPSVDVGGGAQPLRSETLAIAAHRWLGDLTGTAEPAPPRSAVDVEGTLAQESFVGEGDLTVVEGGAPQESFVGEGDLIVVEGGAPSFVSERLPKNLILRAVDFEGAQESFVSERDTSRTKEAMSMSLALASRIHLEVGVGNGDGNGRSSTRYNAMSGGGRDGDGGGGSRVYSTCSIMSWCIHLPRIGVECHVKKYHIVHTTSISTINMCISIHHGHISGRYHVRERASTTFLVRTVSMYPCVNETTISSY